MDNIFLIGMMGSGKTTTAKELSKLCQRNLVDLDRVLEELSKRSINDIFSNLGESVFRTMEAKALLEASRANNQVIATGGGVVLSAQNIERMRESGRIIYLKTSLPVLWSRVRHSKTRPLLQSESPETALKNLYDRRTPLYESAASVVVVTDGKTPRQVAEELYRILFHEKN